MQRAGIRLGIDRDGAHPEPRRGAGDPAGDLAAIGDQDRGKHDLTRLAPPTPLVPRPAVAVRRQREPPICGQDGDAACGTTDNGSDGCGAGSRADWRRDAWAGARLGGGAAVWGLAAGSASGGDPSGSAFIMLTGGIDAAEGKSNLVMLGALAAVPVVVVGAAIGAGCGIAASAGTGAGAAAMTAAPAGCQAAACTFTFAS